VIGRDPEGVETEAVLTSPADRRVAFSAGFHGCMRDSGAGTQNESRNRRYGNATEQVLERLLNMSDNL
jgi:hypothetical protein